MKSTRKADRARAIARMSDGDYETFKAPKTDADHAAEATVQAVNASTSLAAKMKEARRGKKSR